MTKDEIINMSAGRELSDLIGLHVMKFELWDNWKGKGMAFKAPIVPYGMEPKPCNCGDYSQDIAEAFVVANKFLPHFLINYLPSDNVYGEGWHCNINDHHIYKCKTPAEAICKAALLATIK